MRYQFTLALILVLLWGPYAHGSVKEKEQNNLAESSGLVPPGGTVQVTRTFDAHGNIVDPDDPSLIEANPDSTIKPTPFSLTDEMVGQLSGTRDYDWYYLDVSDSSRPVTPVYFECNYEFDFFYEGPGGGSVDEKNVLWRVSSYYDPDPTTPGGAKLTDTYLVSQENCKQGTAKTKGPLRFQMNTDRPGRYYVRVWGNLVEVVEEKETVNGVEIKKYRDKVVAPTGPYSLRVYTTRVNGELEPNDGAVEAYKLTSGTAVTSQLASMYDEDWFYIDNDITKNTTKKLPFYFNCKGQTGTFYALSAYNKDGILQSKYEIKAEQCNGSGGFSFTIDAPVSSRYYFEVSSPTFTEPEQFTQSDYSVLVIASGQETQQGTPADTPTRKDGDLEPNEKSVDAYPLPRNVGITAQLASNIDQDWFAINYEAASNSTGMTSVYFDCKGLSNSAAVFEISAYNPQKVLQSNYTVSAAQCSTTGGFKFSLPTPITGTYFILVNSPANTDPATFSQSDYTLRWAPVIADGQGTGTGGDGVATRKEGELEPNEKPVDAYPLTNIQAVTAQLSAVEDLDYFYYDNGGSAQATPIYFRCWLPVDDTGAPISSAIYTLSAYNSQGVLQNTYTVDASQCSVEGGFKFDLATPTAERYYIRVAGPADQDPENFSNADYTLSTFLNLAGRGAVNVDGSLKNALILDKTTAGKDSFTVKVGRCGSNKGMLKLTGNKLNLNKQEKTAQVKVQIGTWSCVSDPQEFTITTPDANTKAYAYPKPPAAVQKGKKPQISGGAG
jgi:hypothetical protein